MDVRCEKCQTEYELDESRLKPGGVTVKCTNCGHMFKIRKRTPTNVGVNVERARTGGSKPPAVGGRAPTQDEATTTPSRAKSLSDESATVRAATDLGSGPTAERQWLIRLENGEQKSCRELATLQQWIVAGIVTRESLISRSGKTWKRLGDIGELGQYFVIADEARTQRAGKPTPGTKPAGVSTLPGHKPAAAAGGTVLPDDDLDGRATGRLQARRAKTTPPPPPPARTPPAGGPANPLAQTELAAAGAMRKPPTDPPPVPHAKPPSVPEGGRSTALWASSEVKASESMAAMPQGPQGGRLAAIPDEPAFAGRVRVSASDEASFDTGRVSRVDDDDDYLPVHRGSRAGLWITILSLLVIAGAAGVIYMFAFRQDNRSATPPAPRDAAATTIAPIASAKADAAASAPPAPDAPPPPSPLESARTELVGNVAARMKGSLEALASQDDPEAQAVRARLLVAIAQDELDRAGLVDKDAGEKLRKDARDLVTQAAQLAQHAVKAKADDAAANLAMAEVMRLQSKSAHDVHRYLDAARDKAGSDAELARAAALAGARLLERDKKLDDAAKALAAIDNTDVRVAIAAAVIAYEQNRTDDAKKALDAVIAQAPDQETAQALAKKLETTVAKTDPLPPEDHHTGSNSGGTSTPVPPPETGGGYDGYVAKANALAETNCAKAMELYQKALDIKAQGVEALTGMGYCHLDAKQFASAFSNFRSALMVSPRYEPALGGIAETYQRQGNRDQAIESWRKYLEVFPGSAKAKKQLEILGATDEGSAAPAPAPAPAPTPAPAPAPTPAPAPAPPPAPAPAAGSGSGSG